LGGHWCACQEGRNCPGDGQSEPSPLSSSTLEEAGCFRPHPKFLAVQDCFSWRPTQVPVAPGIDPHALAPESQREEGRKEGGREELDSLTGKRPEVLTPNRQLMLWKDCGFKSQYFYLQTYKSPSKPQFPHLPSGLIRLTSWYGVRLQWDSNMKPPGKFWMLCKYLFPSPSLFTPGILPCSYPHPHQLYEG
jgi:hypothetical protein